MKKEILALDWSIENEYFARGYSVVCGTDEAGRGPLAGHVVAAAVILPPGLIIDGLNDSKKLTEKRRENLYDIICESALSYGIASASEKEIDEINILNASMLAMKRAAAKLDPQPELILVDGNVARGFDIEAVPVIKGDAKSPSIAAASVLAKVTRDRMCLELDEKYPEYGFAAHKGYPTKAHMEAVIRYGPCPAHRRSFLSFADKKK